MTTPAQRQCWIVCFIVLLAATASSAEDVRILSVEDITTAFGGEELLISRRVIGEAQPEGTLRWSHSANQRTLARGETEIEHGGAVSGSAEFALRLPEVRDGVVFETTITTEFIPTGSDKAAARSSRRLTLFPRDVLSGKTAWASELDIELFDPVGLTTQSFDALKLPYRSVRNSAAVNDPDQRGVLIIGEGVSLDKQRSLADASLKAAAAGRRVLMLAPLDGILPLPGTDGRTNPGELRFAREHIITQMGKRLDAKTWTGTNNVIPAIRLTVASRRGRVEVNVSEDSAGWPWMEVHFPDSEGVLVVCGFQLIKHIDNGPTPRNLLVRILESLP